ncbi:MAG TPA: hypothetical protein PKD85_13335, partial [Saprospiraceae bacterium]|nr:hypothetical protein [Saprospiraceae bacterium]
MNAKLTTIGLMIVLSPISILAQFYAKAGIIKSTGTHKFEKLVSMQSKPSLTFGIGQEFSITNYLSVDAGLNFVNLASASTIDELTFKSLRLVTPVVMQLKPIKLIDFGTGL